MRRQGTIIAIVLTILFETWSIEALKNRGPKKPKPWEDPDRDTSDDLLVTKKVYFDIEIDDEPIGKIVIALFGETCPVTVQNFAALARGGWKRDVSANLFHRRVGLGYSQEIHSYHHQIL